jgi:plasmid stabilization system protein ParE
LHHIATDNFAAANGVTADIERAIARLGKMPGKGHMRADVEDPQYRVGPVHSYVIVYSFDDTSLTVARILHGARDFPKLFP